MYRHFCDAHLALLEGTATPAVSAGSRPNDITDVHLLFFFSVVFFPLSEMVSRS